MKLVDTTPGVDTPSRSKFSVCGSCTIKVAEIVPSVAIAAEVIFTTSPGRTKFTTVASGIAAEVAALVNRVLLNRSGSAGVVFGRGALVRTLAPKMMATAAARRRIRLLNIGIRISPFRTLI
jgi:hypothetical protein